MKNPAPEKVAPEKVAIVLFNLGGPDSVKSVKPFLFNFFMDKNIIRLPFFLRWFLAKFIARSRSKRSYALLNGKSPLLENTKKQAQALEKELKKESGTDFKIFICMRYWHPMAEEIVQKVKAYNPDKIILLPLYPQFSTTTTRSSFEAWERAAKKLDIPTASIRCYPCNEGFIKASAKNIKRVYERALKETKNKDLPAPRVLFSAHGLPEKIIKDGDPYQEQCEQTAQAIIKELDIPMLDYVLCYQSKLGYKKWLTPSTHDTIIIAGADNVPVIVYPHAFVSEHIETLVEIEIEYRALAKDFNVPYFARVETVGIAPDFIKGLADLVNKTKEQPSSFIVRKSLG